ncbi:hypothetical protein [Gordonia amicalis]|uniref:hypothetical protein n=1 Tax=Gordonia amicalis TaxID=89053 RepID=UPI0024B95B94|nr:hypothetical protein [Gordonia amicalis]MDJ0455174.1 hypothetical protein [Gordonia amicalis]MDV7078638.1 hypothetical protein [Gordonia amicalis]
MLDYGTAPDAVSRYISATRGTHSNYDNPMLPTFFNNCVAALSRYGFDASHVRMSQISSHVGDVETIHTSTGSHIIYDSRLRSIHFALLSALFNEAAPSLSYRPMFEIPGWVHAIHAARYLAGGQREKAAFNAFHAYEKKQQQPPGMHNPDLVGSWTAVMSAYSIAHELAHCTIRDTADVIARAYASDYEKAILEAVRYLDSNSPIDLLGNMTFGPLETMQIPRITESGIQYVAATEDEDIRKILETKIVPRYGAKITLEERLDSIMSNLEGIGEEVICDALAIVLTTILLGDKILNRDETFMACHMAARANQFIRKVDLALKPSGRSGSLLAATSFEDKADSLDNIWATYEETWLRTKFSAIWTAVIFKTQNQAAADADISRSRQRDSRPDNAQFNARELHLSTTLNALQDIFDNTAAHSESISRCALETDLWYINVGAASEEFRELASEESLSDEIAQLLLS